MSFDREEPIIKTGSENLSIFEIMQRYRNDGSCDNVIQDALFRLSLLDSQEAGGPLKDDDELVAEMNQAAESLVRDWYCDSQHRDELVDEIAVTLTTAHRRAEAAAATSMRDKCVEAIKSLRATPRGAAYSNAINDAIHKVQSLTLDQQQRCPDCDEAARLAYSDATTPGFFNPKCARHQVQEKQ